MIVPWRHHSGGFTDNLISSWHRFFGLPDGNRDSYPTDALHQPMTVDSLCAGLGDIHVAVSRPVLAIEAWAAAAKASPAFRCRTVMTRARRLARSLWFANGVLRRGGQRSYNTMGTALLDGALEALGEPAGMLSMAVRWRPTAHWMIDAGFSEDVVVESAPDITFLLNARYVP